jgi:translation initiation factor IF-3
MDDMRHQERADDKAPQIRINEHIKSFKIRLIDDTGNNVGIIDTRDALAKSRQVGLDLVEVSPQAKPPVCKIMDYRKYIFEQKKKAKGNNHKSPETRELRLSISIGLHDLEIKARKAQEFLDEGSKVILSFKVSGREASKTELINDIAKRFYTLVEHSSTMESKGGVFILTPKAE